MLLNKHYARLIPIVLLVIAGGCSEINSEQPSDIMWSDMTTNTTPIETSETEKTEKTNPKSDEDKVTFLPDCYIDDTDVRTVNIYKGKYHYDIKDNPMKNVLLEQGFKEVNFSYNWYFSNETFNGTSNCPDYVLETISSFQSFDLSEYEYFDGYKVTGYILPESGWDDSLCDDDSLCSVEDFPSHNIPIYALENQIDGVPVGNWTFFSADSNYFIRCEGVFDYSSYTVGQRSMYVKDGKVFMVPEGEYELDETLQENLTVVEPTTIKDAIVNDIITNDSYPLLNATVYAIRLKYIPFVEYSIDKREHVNYEEKYNFKSYNREFTINSDVYIVPVWEYSYHCTSRFYAYDSQVGYINAVTGESMRVTDCNVGDYFSEDGPG